MMPMDPGFCEDFAGRLYGLLIGLEDRLDSVDASAIHYFIDVRHHGLALEEIARTLAHDRRHGPGACRHAGPKELQKNKP